MRRGFLITLVGVAVTLIGYFGYAQWASAPANAAIRLVYGETDPFEDLLPHQALVLVIVLLFINVGVWAFCAELAWRVIRPGEKSSSEP